VLAVAQAFELSFTITLKKLTRKVANQQERNRLYQPINAAVCLPAAVRETT